MYQKRDLAFVFLDDDTPPALILENGQMLAFPNAKHLGYLQWFLLQFHLNDLLMDYLLVVFFRFAERTQGVGFFSGLDFLDLECIFLGLFRELELDGGFGFFYLFGERDVGDVFHLDGAGELDFADSIGFVPCSLFKIIVIGAGFRNLLRPERLVILLSINFDGSVVEGVFREHVLDHSKVFGGDELAETLLFVRKIDCHSVLHDVRVQRILVLDLQQLVRKQHGMLWSFCVFAEQSFQVRFKLRQGFIVTIEEKLCFLFFDEQQISIVF